MIKLYNQDCMEAMKDFPDKYFDLAIVDPPYGNNDAIGIKDCLNKSKQKTNRTEYKLFKNNAPNELYFNELKRISKNQIIWGGNWFGLSGGYICWNKEGTVFGEAELAYCSFINSIRIYKYTWNGMIQQNMKDKEIRIHPTQKPVALYHWLLNNYAKEGDKILDTHLGSGSIAIACHDLHFDLTGYEIDKEYFDAAKERLENHQKQLTFL
jgi:site-specific DNA-methyltransferase (adenine-specific)